MTRVARDVIPGRALGGRREAGDGGGLVLRIVGEMAVVLGVLGVGARVRGVPTPVLGGQVRDGRVRDGRVQGGRGLVAGVTLRGTGRRDVHQEVAGRVARGRVVPGRPAMLGSPVVTGGPAVTGRPVMLGSRVVTGGPAVTGRPVMLGSRVVTGGPVVTGRPVALGSRVVTGGPVVMGRPVALGSRVVTGGPAVLGHPVMRGSPVTTGAGRGRGALGAAQAEAGRQTGLPVSGRPGRAKPGTATGPGRTVEQWGDAGREPGYSGSETAARKAAATLESVHLLRGVAVMAERVARALGRRAAAGLGRQAAARAQVGRGGSLVPGATMGTHGGCPAGSG